ncbi:MAG TPA: protein kinase [Chitinivibrionales bacterium]|nr:protein kinase [Chitinivibrionales bacterium]
MNTSTNAGSPQDPNKKPDFDKTFVEGPETKTGYHSFDTKSRVDATQIGATNPYGQKTTVYAPDDLPSGNEPLPLGSGTIVGLLGAGGMARVYKIWNEKLEVFRAVKILTPTQQSDLKNRFETEAKITAKLRHPNIVEIYSVGDWKGLPFLEMELIDGASLDTIIAKQGKLPPSVCSAVAVFVARALAYAHNQDFLLYGKTYHGIIHRDLKPANIMITKYGELRLMDFGIARPTEASLHTVEGNIVGTMQYLSPEQIDGVDIDGRADVYAFGAILYEMLTGTKTFPQETITNLMKKKITNDYRKFEEFDFSVPKVLAEISQKCLQLDKEDRHAGATELLAAVEEAHRALSSGSPEAVLKAYIANPSSISSAAVKRVPLWLNLKIIIPAAAVLVIGLLIAVFIITGPKPAEPVATAKPVTPPPVAQPSAPVQAPATPQAAGQEPLQPLSPQQPSQEPSQPSTHAAAAEKKPPHGAAHSIEAAQKNRQPQHEAAAEGGPSLDKLKKKYGASDPLEIGQKAMSKNAFGDAVDALEKVPASSPQHEKAFLMLVDAYIQSDNLRVAKEKLLNQQINDAEYSLLTGEMYQRMGRDKDAIDNFQAALTKPSNYRNIRDVRNDALYFTAVAYSEMYKDDPSADNRGMVMQSWRVVKNMYNNAPNSPRFKKAVDELSNIK